MSAITLVQLIVNNLAEESIQRALARELDKSIRLEVIATLQNYFLEDKANTSANLVSK